MTSADSLTIYDIALDKNPANHVALTPTTFLARTASIYPNRIATVHGSVRRTWAETSERCRRLASALKAAGVERGDTVSFMAANTPELFEAQFGVPMAGGVLGAINTRLDPATVAFILTHSETKILFTDREFSRVVSAALEMMHTRPVVYDIDDPSFDGGELLGEKDYESFLASGDPDFEWAGPNDEWDAIALNYTSGTTGNPKGVVYHHRGAYLNATSTALTWAMPFAPVYLWTLPMFHCNGWCFPWILALVAGTSVCLRHVRVEPILEAIRDEKVDHFCAAPIVLNMINNAPPEMFEGITHRVRSMTAGAAPPAAVIEKIESLGFDVTHVYGLTECYGPTVSCAWHDEWDALPREERARLKARQGVRSTALDSLMVADPETMQPVPRDGETLGEVMMRGNVVMKGYLKNPSATEEAFEHGWFHTGDLAVWHSDGYIEIKDRSKDIIISGGENISSLEIESVLYQHPAVIEAAVVAKPDAKWGETPCAFVMLKPGVELEERDLVAFCRQHMAHYKVPRSIIFGPLPKTSTGKIQKRVLRDQAKELALLV